MINIIHKMNIRTPPIGIVIIKNHGITPQKQFPSLQGVLVISSVNQAPTNPIINGESVINPTTPNESGKRV